MIIRLLFWPIQIRNLTPEAILYVRKQNLLFVPVFHTIRHQDKITFS